MFEQAVNCGSILRCRHLALGLVEGVQHRLALPGIDEVQLHDGQAGVCRYALQQNLQAQLGL